jgi:polyhydroxybutyrate depolymerase
VGVAVAAVFAVGAGIVALKPPARRVPRTTAIAPVRLPAVPPERGVGGPEAGPDLGTLAEHPALDPVSAHATNAATPAPVAPDAAPVSAAAPATTEPSWSTVTRDLTVGTLARSYLLVRPSNPVPGERLPVLVVLHGRSMTPQAAVEVTGFLPVVGRAIVVYPAGYGLSWNAGACCGNAHDAGIDDVSFLREVVRDVLATQPDAAPHRVFLAGYSNGGRMAYRMACAAPELFSAIAAAEAVSVYPCARPAPLRVLELASTDDPLLVIDTEQPHKVVNGFTEPSVADVVASWRAADGCLAPGSVTTEGTLTTTRWSQCAVGGAVELDLFHGGSHAWPNGTATEPSAQRLMWRYFRSAMDATT